MLGAETMLMPCLLWHANLEPGSGTHTQSRFPFSMQILLLFGFVLVYCICMSAMYNMNSFLLIQGL